MDTFKQISGRIAPMLEPNIDTDVIMPKQFLKGIDRQGLDKGVFSIVALWLAANQILILF